MSRYINVEWLEENAKEYSLGYYDIDEWATPLSILDSAPSIDIVRCKECKHWELLDYEAPKDGWCKCFDTWFDADDFCSYGCREERQCLKDT